MGPQTILEFLELVSPMVWLCVGTVVLAVIVVRVLILPDLKD